MASIPALLDPDDPYNPKLGTTGYDKVPTSIYFYYVTRTASGQTSGFDYHDAFDNSTIAYDKVEEKIKELTWNARRPIGKQVPPPYGKNCEFMVWNRISYLVFLIDIRGTEFIPGKGMEIDPNFGHGNHTFFDAVDKMIDLSPNQDGVTYMRAAFWCINHMKKDVGGTVLDRGKQRFSPSLNTKPPLPPTAHPDSGGTNMGPPVPPP